MKENISISLSHRLTNGPLHTNTCTDSQTLYTQQTNKHTVYPKNL